MSAYRCRDRANRLPLPLITQRRLSLSFARIKSFLPFLLKSKMIFYRLISTSSVLKSSVFGELLKELLSSMVSSNFKIPAFEFRC